MTARSGMSQLITDLRTLTSAGATDYTSPGTVFTDDQLQSILDKNRRDFYNFDLTSVLTATTDGLNQARYFDYYFPQSNVERAETGSGSTIAWRVTDGIGSVIGTANYTVNYDVGHIQFAADQVGSVRYLTGRQYDVNRSAGAVWRQRAANEFASVDWSSDNHSVKRSQRYDHCIKMAESFEAQGWARNVTLVRSDAN